MTHTALFYFYIFSAARSLALLARGLSIVSLSDGFITRRVSTFRAGSCSHRQIGISGGHMHSRLSPRKKFFTILSSKLWYETTTILPPGRNSFTACGRASSKFLSSLLVAIRSAWKVLVAKWVLLCRYAGGTAPLIISTSSPVVFIGLFFLACS